ncbi:hypothetical protein GCK72_021013 [Caenorhabditis remanei]|uniref:Uncharacterized protein n=1 Tax=Caenorhabditis remanei TaxID=31234 RepID=A0A6A5GH00_CAERE|nr:hypothetical protein GCK72_021013 [Caenorhabditis remanei]KAF1754450.1 hypothetical protein GCK72_021013 [Caenorhabditis remanei]
MLDFVGYPPTSADRFYGTLPTDRISNVELVVGIHGNRRVVDRRRLATREAVSPIPPRLRRRSARQVSRKVTEDVTGTSESSGASSGAPCGSPSREVSMAEAVTEASEPSGAPPNPEKVDELDPSAIDMSGTIKLEPVTDLNQEKKITQTVLTNCVVIDSEIRKAKFIGCKIENSRIFDCKVVDTSKE